MRDALAVRLATVGLELHPDKTRIVYCQDADRRGDHEVTSFTFLGYTFRPRLAKNRWGKHFVNFLPAVSKDAIKAMGREIRSWHIARRSDKSLEGPGTHVQLHCAGLDQLLRTLLQVHVVSSPTAHQRSSGALGHAQIQTVTPTRKASGRVDWRKPAGDPHDCSRTGASASNLVAGRWEPCKPRGLSTVLRAPGGEIPPGYSLSSCAATPGGDRAGQGTVGRVAGTPGSGLQRGQDADRPPRPRASISWGSTSAAIAAASC